MQSSIDKTIKNVVKYTIFLLLFGGLLLTTINAAVVSGAAFVPMVGVTTGYLFLLTCCALTVLFIADAIRS